MWLFHFSDFNNQANVDYWDDLGDAWLGVLECKKWKWE